jgi:hypothetical protein
MKMHTYTLAFARQKTGLLLSLAAMAVFTSTSAFSSVVVSQSASGLNAGSPYVATFGGGNLAIETATAIATAGSTTLTVNTGAGATGILQTFLGNSQNLEGFAFFSPGVNNPTAGNFYTISLLDYGTTGPITTTALMNGSSTTVFSDTFTFPNTLARQYYFDFQGADTVTLDSTHYYGIDMQFSNAGGSGNVNSSRANADVYANGAIGTGPLGTFAAVSPSRDLAFALYTTPVPEPSAFAMLGCGLAALLAVRRSRS